MMMLFKKNIVFFFLVFAFSIGYLVTALSLGKPILNNRLEPSFFPILLGSFAVLFSTILLKRELVACKQQAATTTKFETTPTAEQSEATPSKYAPILIILSIFTYILAFAFIGYFVSSFVFVLSIIVIFSSLEKIIQKSIISIVIVLVGYLVFDQLFGVRLPALWG